MKSIPLILTGLVCVDRLPGCSSGISARKGSWRWVGLPPAGIALFVPKMVPNLPNWATMVLAFIAAMLGGAVWALIPALLKAFIHVNEIITTLMLNYVAVLWIEYLFYGPWKDSKGYGFPGSAQFDKSFWLGRIDASWVQPAGRAAGPCSWWLASASACCAGRNSELACGSAWAAGRWVSSSAIGAHRTWHRRPSTSRQR